MFIKIDYITLFGSTIELATPIKSIINFKSIYPANILATALILANYLLGDR
ncbi:MAG: hypothetical protein MR782_05505 [Campylobacter sp.]|nr:hypothetical protein [Campylobacter sp.]